MSDTPRDRHWLYRAGFACLVIGLVLAINDEQFSASTALVILSGVYCAAGMIMARLDGDEDQ